jgi:hypothetical protein
VAEGLASSAPVGELFDSLQPAASSPALLAETSALVRDRLVTAHHWPLSPADLDAIDRALRAFAEDGPAIHYWRGHPVDADTVRPSYRQLMTAPDLVGERRSFLASDEDFAVVKELQRRNLIVPVVGDVSGTTAMAQIAGYARSHGDVVRGFYGSNVAVYLTNRQQAAFCVNLARLPGARSATFIDSDSVRPLAEKLDACEARAAKGK